MNRYTQLNEFRSDLYAPPVDLIGKAMELSQQRYDKNLALASEIQNNFIPSLPQDRKKANELQDYYSKQVDDVVSKYRGDYSQASNDLTSLLYKIKKDFGPGGEAGAIIQNYKNYQDWMKESQDLVEKGKALGEDLNLANNYFLKNYQGIGQRDPVTGSFNRFTPETLTQHVDPEGIIQDVYKNFKPQKTRVGRTVFKNGLQTQITEEVEGISPDRLYPSFNTALQSNPGLMQYAQQKARFLGVDPEQVLGYFDQYSQQRARDLSYMNTVDEQKSERDPLMLVRERARLAKKNQEELLKSFYQYEPTVDVVSKEQSTITPDNYDQQVDWKTNVAQALSPLGLVIPGAAGLAFGTQVYAKGAKDEAAKTAGKPFAELLKDPQYVANTRIDKPLAEASMDIQIGKLSSNPNEARAIFDRKYGKDKKWTKEFDRKTVAYYKQNEANNSRYPVITQPIVDPDANKQVISRIAGQMLDPNRVSVYKIGSPGITSAASFGLKSEDILSKDRAIPQAAYAKPGPGLVAAGYQIPTPKGTFVFVDQDTRRQAASDELAAGLNPIFRDGLTEGGIMPIGFDGKEKVLAIPKVNYILNSNGLLDMRLEGHRVQQKNGSFVLTGEVYPLNLEALYQNYEEDFKGYQGSGASSKNFKLFTEQFEF